MAWPKRLEPDPIAEALFEVQFESTESAQLPDLVVARLFDNPNWRSGTTQRLPLADMPSPLRANDPALKFLPVLQVHNTADQRLVKIGANSLSYHVLAPYPGGTVFIPEVKAAVEFLFSTLSNVRARRLGLRYVNLVASAKHQVPNIAALNFSVELNKERLSVPLVLTYRREHSALHTATVRISSPDFILGVPIDNLAALIDVDVMTKDGFDESNPERVLTWLRDAREVEKNEFFGLLSAETIAFLGRDN